MNLVKQHMEMEMLEAEQLDKFQKDEGAAAQKEREINNGKEGGVASGQGSKFGNMEEALVSSVIQKLDNRGISAELRMILNFLRDKTPGELNRLDYLICKVMETALNLNNIMETDGSDLIIEPISVRRRLRDIRMRMIKSGEEKNAIILISSVIQKLEHHHVESSSFNLLSNRHVGEASDVKGVIDELRMIVGFLSDKSSAEVRRLDWLICEAIEMALYLDLIEGTYDLWEEARSVKSKLQGIKLRMLRSGVDGEDPEVLILLVIQNLDAQLVEIAALVGEVEEIKGVMNELRMILDLLREEKTDLILRRRRHKYLICDLIEMSLYLNEIDDANGDLCLEAESAHSRLRDIRLHMLKSETETETETRSEDVGEGGDAVGLGEQVQLVLRRAIFYDSKGLETAVITGMVGIGKTSLARQVYNHATVVDHFERRAWVCVSTHMTHKEILVKLIQQVVSDSLLILEEMDNRSLQHLLHQHLQGMPYLIVLDDLPKQMHLKSLLIAFPDDEGSRLLVTSSTKNIQTTISYTHLVKPLDSDKSWKLFLNTIFQGDEFSSEQKFPKHLEEKGREMLRKCGGLPLVIKEVALQLAEQRRRGREWEELLGSIDWGSSLALVENVYQQLDEEQKSCFLHLALFKENATIRTEKLLHVLVAGGVASESEMLTHITNLNSEFIIEFKHISFGNRVKSCDINVVLHRLSMKKAEEEIGFEIRSDNIANNPLSQSFPRHRIINCSRKKLDYYTNQDEHLVSLFFRGGGSYLDDTPSFWKSFENELKILDLEDYGLKILPESIGTLIELRYLGLRNNYLEKLPHSLVCLKKLEILDVAQNFGLEVPDIIFDMSSLRRIYMSYAIFQKPLNTDALKNLFTVMYISVDDLICELSNLEMMTILGRQLGTKEKDGSQTMTSLEDLGIEETDGLQTITSPQELSIEEEDGLQMITSPGELGIEEEDGLKTINSPEELGIEEEDGLQTINSPEELGTEEEYGWQTMTSLNRLGIEEVDATSDVRKLFASLAEFDALEHLVLRGFRFRSMPCLDELRVLHVLTTLRLEGLLAKLPSVDNFPPNIRYLRLVNTCLDEDPMPVLEQLPHLSHLKLKNAYTGTQMVISDEWPGALEVLCIEELWNLRNVHVKEGAMKWLEKLEIKNCPFLETLPEEIGSMAELQEFNMTTTRNIATKIRKSGCISKIRVVHIVP